MPTTYPTFTEILRVPGLLYWGTTSLATEAGYGTLLGYTEDGVHFDPGMQFAEIKEEDFGEEITKILYLGSSPMISVNLINYNATALARLFPGVASSATIKFPGTYPSGKALSNTSAVYGRLLFMPDDTTNNPCILLQKAVPHIIETARMNFSHVDRMFFQCVFNALRKTSSSDGMMYIGNKSGATLI